MPPPRLMPLPAPAPTSSLQSCKVSSDCTLHFQVHACAGGEPVAVSVHANPAAVRKAYPVQNIACGMGGPQYDDLRASNENRYSTTCVQSPTTPARSRPCATAFARPASDLLPLSAPKTRRPGR